MEHTVPTIRGVHCYAKHIVTPSAPCHRSAKSIVTWSTLCQRSAKSIVTRSVFSHRYAEHTRPPLREAYRLCEAHRLTPHNDGLHATFCLGQIEIKEPRLI